MNTRIASSYSLALHSPAWAACTTAIRLQVPPIPKLCESFAALESATNPTQATTSVLVHFMHVLYAAQRSTAPYGRGAAIARVIYGTVR